MFVNSNKPINKRLLKTLLGLAVCSTISAVVLLYYANRFPLQKRADAVSYNRTAPLQSMSGFTYTGTFNAKKVIRFRADRMVIDKQKVGFLKFNLMHRVHFKNADIRLFAQSRQSSGEKTAGWNFEDDWTFENTFTKESLPSLPVKRIAAIEFSPITVELFRGDKMLTRVSARSAKVRIRKKAISFKGGVTVVSGGRQLTADRLLLVPGENTVEVKGRCTLTESGREVEGYDWVTDFSLTNIQVNNKG